MNISKNTLAKAVQAQIITDAQANNLMSFLKTLPDQSPQFGLTNVFYYLGGLTAIGAMTLFMTLSWQMYGTGGIFVLTLSYMLLGLAMANLFRKNGHSIPAGICATFTICLTPLAIYSFQVLMGWWPDESTYRNFYRYIQWHWIYMELGTLLVGVILAWVYRYPFMVMPIAFTLWYMSMDLTCMLNGSYDFLWAAKVSLYFGLFMIVIAFWVDIRSRYSADYAFWLYLFGVMTFWSGLTAQNSDSEMLKFIYLCINLLLILSGVILNRRVFVVFGGLGCCTYIGHLAWQVFQYSYLFPIILTIFGFGIIYLGLIWQRHEMMLTLKLRSCLPQVLRELLESRD